MRNELSTLINEYELELKRCGDAKTLEQLQEAYTNVSSMRDEIYDYIAGLSQKEQDPDATFNEYMQNLMERETRITESNPFPIFDESLDEVELFDEYTTYFQRYGCMSVDWILSWDDTNILFHDIESDLVEIIQRPDVLMRGEG